MSAKPTVPSSLSLDYEEGLYEDFLRDPGSVPPDWRAYFEKLPNGASSGNGPLLGPSFTPRSIFSSSGGPPVLQQPVSPARAAGARLSEVASESALKMAYMQDRVDELIRAYRVRGHVLAKIDPLGMERRQQQPIDPSNYGFTEADMDLVFSAATIHGADTLTLREIIQRLHNTYCRSIGVEFMHINDLSIRRWLEERMESTENHLRLGHDEQFRILTRLTDAVIFEEFIQKKFLGAKSFSLEGAESLIPLLDLAIERAGDHGIKEIVVGMAHRGRLNVLANIMGKSPREIFREFEDMDPDLYVGGGDVKYHLGYHNDWKTASGKEIHLALCFNPSHLEFVNPVALGRTRAKQRRLGDYNRERYMVLLIHGDAAFAGEGIIQETLNLSQLDAYSTGGTVHVVVNNQIGFTTPPEEGRSGVYATDIAKMLQIPIFHVNGEDPEAVAQVIQLSMDFRKTFKRDVVIDMYCYRRRGHNEGDEPSFTQPVLYDIIEKRPSVRDAYLKRLLQFGEVTQQDAERIAEERRQELEGELSAVRASSKNSKQAGNRPSILGRVWSRYRGGPESTVPDIDTGFPDRNYLMHLLEKMTHLPEGFTPHPKIERWLENRRQMARGEKLLDWGAAEALAFATLAVEGARIRMSGQDSARGTFSHRHATLFDAKTGERYYPLKHLSDDQAPVDIYNSPLSEAGVLGFEYGYSIAYPDGLIMWEAQFGDFVNVAQVIIDQFITSAEDKWGSLSGLTLLLPHGFEGMGPEHSSARLERFLMLSAEDNIQVVMPTTPAQFFHALRRQVIRPWRKPLIVMTPKSLLRHPKVVSSMDDMVQGGFRRIIPDTREDQSHTERILLCSGKIYYELDKARIDFDRPEIAILRVEQLYPLEDHHLEDALRDYRDGTPVMWVQEEPANMGAWPYWKSRFREDLIGRFPFCGVSRPESASPATGSANSHHIEMERLLQHVLLDPCPHLQHKQHKTSKGEVGAAH